MADYSPPINWEFIRARLDAHAQLRIWGIDDSAYKALEPLLRISNVDHMTEEHVRVCELLCGPHGWTVYQMLKARMKDGQRERRLKRKHDQPCDD